MPKYWEWVEKLDNGTSLIERFGKLVLAVLIVVGGAGFAIWAFLGDLAPPYIGLIGFAALVLTLWLFVGIRALFRHKPIKLEPDEAVVVDGFAFYPDRAWLNKGRGGIQDEIQSAEKVWVAWSTAAVAESTGGILDNPRLAQLLLIDPGSQYINFHAKPFRTPKREIRDRINQALRDAHESNNRPPRTTSQSPIAIKTYNGPITDTLVIGNPHFKDIPGKEAETWIRVETSAPYEQQQERPSFVISKSSHPRLYEAMFRHYLDMWDDAFPYPNPQLTLDTLDSQSLSPATNVEAIGELRSNIQQWSFTSGWRIGERIGTQLDPHALLHMEVIVSISPTQLVNIIIYVDKPEGIEIASQIDLTDEQKAIINGLPKAEKTEWFRSAQLEVNRLVLFYRGLEPPVSSIVVSDILPLPTSEFEFLSRVRLVLSGVNILSLRILQAEGRNF